jgi:single-stranded-DNA-specific exonuclease
MLLKRWIGPKEIASDRVARLVADLGVAPVVARVLVSRGKSEPDEVRRFLRSDLTDLSPPRAFLGADAALDALHEALRERRRILLFGDFDVDGVSGTSIAYRTLQAVGANVEYFLPKRLVHGYGLSRKALPDVRARRPDLVVTVDCGIRSVDEVAELAEAGIDTIITDHHEPGHELPPARAIVNPKQAGCPYPDKRLAGCGVVFQLMRGLVGELEHELNLERHLDLVALGTVADVVPLDGENRILVSRGLERLSRREKVGVMALVQTAGIEDQLEAWHLAYLLGPRINAAGRLGDAEDAVRLFTTDDTALANDLAKKLDVENERRQEISATTLTQAIDAVERGVAGTDPAGIVLASDGWHPGVIGIAASKVVERFHRPTVLIAMDGGVGRGSVRSIPGIDVCEVLDGCEDLLVQYGGHSMAAGLAIARERIPEFRARFGAKVAARLTAENSQPCVRIDGTIVPEEVELGLAGELEQLGPFGYGNPRPTFVVRAAELAGSPRVVGRGHLKLAIRRDGAPALDCIGFDLGEKLDGDGLGQGPLDIVGQVSVNEWNGQRKEQLQIVDVRAGTP